MAAKKRKKAAKKRKATKHKTYPKAVLATALAYGSRTITLQINGHTVTGQCKDIRELLDIN